MKFVERGQADPKEIDTTVKNKWNWGWCDKIFLKDTPDEHLVGDCFRKLHNPGEAWCLWCNDTVRYGGGGLNALCIFHGPQIELSFSIMSDIVDKHAGRMNMQTFSAIQTVKHYLLTRSTDALTAFKDPNPRPTRNMFSAAGAYKATKKAVTKKAEIKLTSEAAFKPGGGQHSLKICDGYVRPH